jgi:hypothetical protein
MASASSAWSPTMSAPRFMPASPRVSAELPETGERFEGCCRPSSPRRLRDPQARRRRVHARRLCRRRDHVGGQAEALRTASPTARQHPRRRRHLDRQDHAHQCAAGRSRQDLRSRRADRGHARAAMRRAQPRRHAHQGRRRLALRSRPLLAAPAPRPHPDRRGARRRSPRPPQSLGHRPSRRRRHHPRRHRASARCAAWSSSSRKPSSPSRAR